MAASNHPLEHKQGVVMIFMQSADCVVSDSRELKEVKEHIRNALRMNGYPDRVMDRLDSPKNQDLVEEEVEEGSMKKMLSILTP